VFDKTHLDLIDVSDIARFATAALYSPPDFSGKKITLAVEKLTGRAAEHNQ
jgi:hypothetical protein